ncbi:MAG: preprotein translocase subunit SecG [Prevotellaceae bacterium]|jgi:preprotein translocase subunit SecG|nr:preprotein translocase subunit SecG [Prevotellaceae bacterium]
MFNLLIVLIVIAAILLVVIVLAQNPKGGGLAQGFSSSNQFMGVQNTNKFLTKATWSLVGFIAFASIISAGIAINRNQAAQTQSEVISDIKEAPAQQQQQSAAPAAAVPFGEQAQ